MDKRSYKKWSKEEEDSLLDLIKSHSISEAITIHAREFGRNAHSVNTHYYRSMMKNIPEEERRNLPLGKKPYSESELKDLLELVSAYPHNMREAFRIHANNTGRNAKNVENFFGRYRRKQEAKVCMATIGGKKHSSPNRKNIYPGTGGCSSRMPKSLWRRILNVLFGI